MKEEIRDLSIGEALDLGAQFMRAGSFENAATMFRGVLAHEPNNFEAVERLGSSLFEQGRHCEAFYWFWRGRELDRRHPLALTNYGLTVSQLGHPEKGLSDLERAAAIAERSAAPHVRALVWNNLGNTLERLGRYKDALVALDKGIACNPEDAFPQYNRGIVMIRLGRHEEAIESFDRCLALHALNLRPRPGEIADARYNRGMARLALGDLKGGFEDYEYRLTTTENKEPNFGFPPDKKWKGEALPDTPLLIIGEQGLGDTIQFLRFIPEARRRARKLTLSVQSAIAPMVRQEWPDIPLLPAKTTIAHDQIGRWAPLMSLPHLLGIGKESELPPPWFPPLDDARFDRFMLELPSLSPLRVGVCWAGNFHHQNDANRSVPIDVFARIFDLPFDFISLQQLRPGEIEQFAELRQKHANLAAFDLADLQDTAVIAASCNLVISADTAVAHLAASIGRPTWVLIPAQNTDWRWQLNRNDSPWYPSARLWRQERGKGWAPLVSAIVKELHQIAVQRARAA